MTIATLPKLYTEDEAAEYLGIKSDTLARIRRAGRIAHIITAGRRVRYTEPHILAYLEEQSKCLANSALTVESLPDTVTGTSSAVTARPLCTVPASVPAPTPKNALASALAILGRLSDGLSNGSTPSTGPSRPRLQTSR